MKIFIAFLLFLFVDSSMVFAGERPARLLAFERDDAVWISHLDGTRPKRIARGQEPELSPDGTRLAYNTLQKSGRPAHRKLAIYDLATKKTTILQSVPSDNCMEPRWSQDGKRLIFAYYANNERIVGFVNPDGSGFVHLPEPGRKHQTYWAAAWAADGKSFFAEDMANLYRITTGGKILNKWAIEKLIPRGGMSGNVRLDAAPDGKSLLMDIEMAEKERKGWDGPPASIWTLDLTTKKSVRLTPKSLYAWDGRWLDAPKSILFISQAPGETRPSIYRMSTASAGDDRKLLVKNARTPSAPR